MASRKLAKKKKKDWFTDTRHSSAKQLSSVVPIDSFSHKQFRSLLPPSRREDNRCLTSGGLDRHPASCAPFASCTRKESGWTRVLAVPEEPTARLPDSRTTASRLGSVVMTTVACDRQSSSGSTQCGWQTGWHREYSDTSARWNLSESLVLCTLSRFTHRHSHHLWLHLVCVFGCLFTYLYVCICDSVCTGFI